VIIAFDGTWDDAGAQTNVRKFFDAYQRRDPFAKNLYLSGVGTHVSWLGRLAGGIFGAGEAAKVAQALAHIEAHSAEDPAIDIIGFSRGAATALDLANRIHKETSHTIRFLGLWDTVAAFGLANLGWYFSRLTFGHQIYLPPDRLLYACHALALDERRPSFVVTRLHGADEVWFRGVHTDVGGSGAVGLSNIALRWMLRKAAGAGLPLTEADALSLAIDPTTAPSFNEVEKVETLYRRTVAPTDLVHYTVGDPIGNPRETAFDESCIALAV
jgi:uncharacterized protein (DUF2235 family)